MKMFHTINLMIMPLAVCRARLTRTNYATPLTSQLFDLWNTCLTLNSSLRPTNILSLGIPQSFTTHTTLQLFVESSITIAVPLGLEDMVPHPQEPLLCLSLLFRSPIQLMLTRMFFFMNFCFSFIFSVSRALYGTIIYQLLNDELVVRLLKTRIMLHFVLFIPVVSLIYLHLQFFLMIYVTNFLCDIIMSIL